MEAGLDRALLPPLDTGESLHSPQGARCRLTIAFENRPYVEALGEFLRQQPYIRTVIFDGGPPAMNRWGIEGAMHWFQPSPDLRICDLADEQSREFLQARNLAIISWDRPRRKLVTATRLNDPDPSSIVMATGNPVWLFGNGWYPLESEFAGCSRKLLPASAALQPRGSST